MPLAPGTRLGPYEILAPLGAGGMGEVYRARDTRLERCVAIKILPAQFSSDPVRKQRFEREAKTISNLNHPHISILYDVGYQDGMDYLVMECIEGETLAKRLERGALPTEQVLKFGAEIADALDKAHRAGIVHRDIKPSNIFVLPDEHTKLLDFGLAKTVEGGNVVGGPQGNNTTTALTSLGSTIGTLPYMSPEQALGKDVDTRTDLFSFGVVLYEMVTGQRPFSGSNPVVLTHEILTKNPSRPIQLAPKMPPPLSELISRALEKDENLRYQTAADIRSDLQRIAQQEAAKRYRPPSGSGLQTVAANVAGKKVSLVSVMAASVAVLLLGLGLTYALRPEWFRAGGAARQIRSVAVLPLNNVSAESNQQYFADGMTDELISELSQIRVLRVISPASVAKYRDTRKTTVEIARELGVDAVIEGSVLRAAERVRLTAQLIDGKTNSIVWSHSYERNSKDVINLQKQLASDVSHEVGARLGASELAHLSAGRTVLPEVYDALLQGRFHQQRGTRVDINRAIEYFQKAISLDPEFAPAYASLSSAYTDLRSVYAAPREVMPKAKAAALKAIELDGTLPEGHAALGNVMMYYDYDWQGAERELVRAIELRPSFAEAHVTYGELLSATKRKEEAKAQILEARKLDPISPFLAALAAATFYNLRDYDNSIKQAREAVELDPDLWLANAFLGLALQKKGDLDGAIKVLEHARTVNDSPTILEMLGGVYAEAGRTEDAKKIVDAMIQRNSQNYVCPYEIATTLVALQEKEAALHWLKKSIEARADCSPWMGVDAKLDPLRSDPRFREMVKGIGLDPDMPKTQ